MIVKLLKPWKWRKVGTILSDCPDGTANLLIKRGVVEKVEAKQPRKDKVRG